MGKMGQKNAYAERFAMVNERINDVRIMDLAETTEIQEDGSRVS